MINKTTTINFASRQNNDNYSSDFDIVTDNRIWVRHAVAQSLTTNPEVLRMLSNDEESCVRLAAVNNPKFPTPDEFGFDDI